MGMIFEEITLKNAFDVGNCERGNIKEHEIHQATIQAVVDTGAATLVINEELRQQLGLRMRGTTYARQADNKSVLVNVAEAVEVHWKNRVMTCQPWVFSDSGKVLLGAIPLEDMDLIVDPVKQMLVGAHGDEQVGCFY